MEYYLKFSSFFIGEAAEINNGTNAAANTQGIVINTDEVELNNRIQEWNTEYSQAFKFQNDMPKDINAKVDITNIGQKNPTNDPNIEKMNQDLLNKVRDGVIKLATLLTTKNKDGIFIFKDRTISIQGHTSSPAKPEYNMELSKRRANFVISAIKNAMLTILTTAGDKTTPESIIKFIAVPKGETNLIINNDTVQDNAILNTNNKEIDGTIDVTKYSTPEQKQALNRRVVISLDKFPVRYKQPDLLPSPVRAIAKQQEIPTVIPTNIKFNLDSYVLTQSGDQTLSKLAENIIAYNKSNENKIKDIYICSHSHRGKGVEKNIDDTKNIEKKIFIISLNRSVAVEKYLQSHGVENVKFHLIPCSFLIPAGKTAAVNKRVEIYFEVNNEVKQARTAFGKLSKEYDIDNLNNEYTGEKIIRNNVLREDIIKNITAYMRDPEHSTQKWIPLELWFNEYSQNEENLEEYQKELTKTVKKYGRGRFKVEDFVYDKE